MYIEKTTTYYKGSDQKTQRARFLILVQPDCKIGSEPKPEIRAIVRKVALSQCGHWMIGKARAFGHTIMVSGAYGSDGLPMTVPNGVYQRAIPVPANLLEAWNNGGGWNGAGSEAQAMREWALTL
jgi:hypothetical protein